MQSPNISSLPVFTQVTLHWYSRPRKSISKQLSLIHISLPNGTTLEQMNQLMGRMEAYLSTFKDIRQFQTNIYSARQAGIRIYFTKAAERSGFPYTLKSKIISKALEPVSYTHLEAPEAQALHKLESQMKASTGIAPVGVAFDNQLNISVDRQKLLLYNVNYNEVYRLLKTAFKENEDVYKRQPYI